MVGVKYNTEFCVQMVKDSVLVEVRVSSGRYQVSTIIMYSRLETLDA
jgi:hypothetical protein